MRGAIVLIFFPSLTNGGAERQGALVARWLLAHGCTVSVWGFPSVTGRAQLGSWLERARIPHAEIPQWPRFTLDFGDWRSPIRALLARRHIWPRQLRAFAALLPETCFDAVIPFTFWPSLVASVLSAQFAATKTIWNHRGGFDPAGIRYSPFMIEKIRAARPAFVANSTAGADFLRHTFDLERADVRVIRNAFVPESADPWPVSEHSSASSTLGLIHIANQ